MKTQPLLALLTIANFCLLAVLLAKAAPTGAAPATDAVLRGRALEIVDGAGRVRASITLLPPAQQATGGISSETVLLRLINSTGQPSVKIAASETTAGLSFVGGDDLSYVVLSAEGPATTLKMVEPHGRQQILSP
jgi:hypothetical protein